MLIGNIEADELIMQTVTSIAKRDYVIKFKSGAELNNNRRSDKRELITKMTRLGKVLDEDYTLELRTTYKPLPLAIFIVEKQLRKLHVMTECDRFDIWVGPTDGSNFRFKSAKTEPYKSNRAAKPDIVVQLRDYLINFKGAQVIWGYEADDALGIYQTKDTVAIHCDKDIFMIPGLHYDTIKDKFITVTELGELVLNSGKVTGNGLYFFYYQLIVGDRTDTIPSLKSGLGPVKAFEILNGLQTEKDLLLAVHSLFITVLEEKGIERLLEQADLVWICRDRTEKGSDYIKRRYMEYFGETL